MLLTLDLLASPNIIAIRTANEATVRENFDCIQSLLNQIRMRNDIKTTIEANLMRIKSGWRKGKLLIV